MIKVSYTVQINAPVAQVYDRMLGLSDISTYESWTKLFNPTSSWEGSWDKGSKIYFIGFDDKGNKGGMVSEIAENKPCEFVSIRHIGMLQDGKEITTGKEVESWAGSLENYTFEVQGHITQVTVELDTAEDFVSHMDKTYPKALEALKETCEV